MLLSEICKDFIVLSSDVDESSSYNLPYLECVKDLAKKKAQKIFDNHKDDVVIGADTIVVFNDKIIHKPIDEQDAYHILKMLSNNEHLVLTAYCICYKDKQIVKVVTSKVKFFKLNDDTIYKYIREKKPLDKAGAYGIQDSSKEYPIVESFTGSYTNIVGLPIESLYRDLKDLKII